MGLESFGYISDLVSSNPAGTDLESQGDDHIRGIKSTLISTFPNGSRAFRFPAGVAAKTAASYSVVEATDMHKLIPVDTTSNVVTIVLPTATIDGWWCIVFKANSGSNAVTIDPAGSVNINGASTLSITKQYDGYVCW